jgi:serine/threonine protein phosphatase PrpC
MDAISWQRPVRDPDGAVSMASDVARAMAKLRFNGAMLTDIGSVRALNEDAVVYATPQNAEVPGGRGSLALVADGMGGHAAGEIASALAAEVVRRVYFERDGPEPDVLLAAFAAANRAILEWAERDPACKGMGTTCTALVLRDDQAWLAHVGDSRAYLLRKGVLKQLTEDQTLVAKMVSEGTLTKEEAAQSPVQNIVLQALGTGPDIEPVISQEGMPLSVGDTLILCSDGLSGMVPDTTIAELAGRLPPHEACRALIDAALAAGGHDNISLGIFCALSASEETTAASHRTTRRIMIADKPREQNA